MKNGAADTCRNCDDVVSFFFRRRRRQRKQREKKSEKIRDRIFQHNAIVSSGCVTWEIKNTIASNNFDECFLVYSSCKYFLLGNSQILFSRRHCWKGKLWRQMTNVELSHLIIEESVGPRWRRWRKPLNFTWMIVWSQQPLEERHCFYIVRPEWKSNKSLNPNRSGCSWRGRRRRIQGCTSNTRCILYTTSKCTVRATRFSINEARRAWNGGSIDITTFSTHSGLYSYRRLMFGVPSAPEIYQHAIQHGCQRCA